MHAADPGLPQRGALRPGASRAEVSWVSRPLYQYLVKLIPLLQGPYPALFQVWVHR